MPDLGLPELLVILVLVLILFGGKKLPEFSRSMGEAIRELRNAFKEEPKEDGTNQTKKTISSSSPRT